jgi:hypothetical protein
MHVLWSRTDCEHWKARASGKVKIPYYVVISGRGYWNPKPRMKALGFSLVRCVISLEGTCGLFCFNVHSDKWACICRFERKRNFDLSEQRFRRSCRPNPDDEVEVHRLKQAAAELIDFCQAIPVLAGR